MTYSLHDTFEHLFGFFVPHQKIFILYLFTSFVMAWFVWLARIKEQRGFKKFLKYVFNPQIYGHKSSRQDYAIFIVNGITYFGLIGPFMLSETRFSLMTAHALQAWFGQPVHPLLSAFAGTTLLTLTIAILHDFSVYAAHYAFHKVPALWAFHKVHHSAEVMTPVTVLRLHPLEMFLNTSVIIVLVGTGFGLFSYLTMQKITDMRIFDVNLILFITYMTGVHLRHSHVWLHYPAWLSRILVSPAQHHIHHSAAARHFDKNLGFVFSFWDRMFGTLYVPPEREDIEFGVNEHERNPYLSVKQMYLKPCKELLASLWPKQWLKNH